ncbi:hypothetical protein E5Q_00106 [Mixia osmundae IAM 14324]|uniref:VPS9 domain-containing protein n=1 Tax=Mixia osmundae (strain CBS 9802 / IAM 14324 / JCM 22182 / KY 12970) TaxID=764103 RepID=G7DSA5_MIXOS|nr:hypothetical protein E5Q_00106 [Mixia osmundae IAM 14324]
MSGQHHPLLASSQGSEDGHLAERADGQTETSDYKQLHYKPRSRGRTSGSGLHAASQAQANGQASPLASVPLTTQSVLSTVPTTSASLVKPLTSPTNVSSSSSLAESSRALTAVSNDYPTPAPSPTSATAKLKLQSLQSSVQALGLSTNSAGWLMLSRLIELHTGLIQTGKGARPPQDTHGWTAVWTALSDDRVTFLLPKDGLPPNETITPALVRDHLVLLDSNSLSATPGTAAVTVATLNGLRGVKADDTVIFGSAVPGISTLTKDAGMDEELMSTLLGSAPPYVSSSTTPAFPCLHLLSVPSKLSVPKPTLNNSQGQITRPQARTLASLFGGIRAERSISTSSSLAASPLAESPPSLADPTISPEPSLDLISVRAIAVDRVIRRAAFAREIAQATAKLCRSRLRSQNVSAEASDLVVQFLARLDPPKGSEAVSISTARTVSTSKKGKTSITGPLYAASAEELARAYQGLCLDIARIAQASTESSDSINEEVVTQDALEAVEDVLVGLSYDRLFCIDDGKDRADDVNLASRIAGLNMLDFSLDHLSLQLEPSSGAPAEWDEAHKTLREGIEDIVRECGEMLKLLSGASYRTPKSKLDLFVRIHKALVDGISKLPAIPTKPEVANESEASTELEMADAINSSLREASVRDGQNASQSSADLLLPILIFSVVRANPSQFISHLRLIERFRCELLLHGETAYCVCNLQAVVEYLLHIDLSSVGMGSARVISSEDGSPTQTTQAKLEPAPASSIRARVTQEMDIVATGATRMLGGVAGGLATTLDGGVRLIGGSFGLLTKQPVSLDEIKSVLDGKGGEDGAITKRLGLLRRASSPLTPIAAPEKPRGRAHTTSTPLEHKELAELTPPAAREGTSNGAAPVQARLSRTSSSTAINAQPGTEDDKPSISDRLAAIPGLNRLEPDEDAAKLVDRQMHIHSGATDELG